MLPSAADRSFDNPETERSLERVVLALSADLGIQLWRLPTSYGVRLATTEERKSELMRKLRDAIKQTTLPGTDRGLSLSDRRVEVKNNLYEFDQEQFVAPAVAEYLTISVAVSGTEKATYLARRGVRLEFIERVGDYFVIPTPGKGPRIYQADTLPLASLDDTEEARRPDWPYPIDLVYTWVDSNDETWQRNFASVADEAQRSAALKAATNASRWATRDELRFSLRSVEMYAPFVRNIFIVTNGQQPKWLTENPRVTIVSHDQLYPDTSVLPTFNSNHIETVLHRIPGLAEHFLYLNDDFFFSAPCAPQDFFTVGGLGKLFFSPRHLSVAPVLPGDRATVACHKNSRDILERKFGVECSQKFQHAPYVMRRSVWYEIEETFPEDLARTRANRFRSSTDVNGQFLYGHFALLTGKGHRGAIGYQYLEIEDGGFSEKLARIEELRAEVFCLNDSNSDGDRDPDVDLEVAAALNARFPVPAPWEDSDQPPGSPLSTSSVDANDQGALEREVRTLGVAGAERAYLDLIDTTGSDVALRKLQALYQNTGRLEEALGLIDRSAWSQSRKIIARVNLEASGGRSVEQVARHIASAPEKLRPRLIKSLVRCVETEDDLAALLLIVEDVHTHAESNPELQQLIARATRRAGLASQAIGHFEAALLHARYPLTPVSDFRRGAQRMNSPFVVLDDLYELAGDDHGALFLDAGTLLGYVREGNFIGHDYDIDLSIRDRDAFERIRTSISTDWRFNVARVRTPDRLIQARHVNGTNVDIFLHVRQGDKWVKSSHVYGWRFSDYGIVPATYRGRTVNVPDPSIPYLEQMYGENWRTPDAGFDSRLVAPNCFFPDRDEIICTLLDKALQAILVGDRDDFARQGVLLRSLLGYELAARERVRSSS